MSGHHDAYFRGAQVDGEVGEVVNNVEEYISHPDQFRLRQTGSPWRIVIVAPDRDQGRHGGEFSENLLPAAIAAMNDVIAAHEKRARVRPQKPVGIRNKSDAKPGSRETV